MSDCITLPNGANCPSPSTWTACRPWDLSKDPVQCYANDLVAEQLDIAGATVNVYKLLGVHEQTKLVDATGMGSAIASGSAPNYPASNAFTMYALPWKSQQTGADVINNATIGYDFGVIKLANGRDRYGVPANVRKTIATIKIKQSAVPIHRATKVRVERSDDGVKWFGVAILTLPNDDVLNTLYFKATVPSRFWRLRALEMAQATSCEAWEVYALQLSEYVLTAGNNIQDKILLENRTRDYLDPAISMKGYYDVVSAASELLKLGIQIPTAIYQIKISFTTCIAALGRPIIIGDIIELPSEAQYSAEMRLIKRYLEVTDVTWDPASYTPGWQPTLLLVTAQPATASEETQDIFGDLAGKIDTSGVFDSISPTTWQDYSDVSATIVSDSKTLVPESGSEGSNTIREFTAAELQQAADDGAPALAKMQFTRNSLYVEDAMPQNGAPYTEGPDLPPMPNDGDYHRLTYVGLSKDIPTRLYRFSVAKNKWLFLETDRRQQFNGTRPLLTEFLTSPTKQDAGKIK